MPYTPGVTREREEKGDMDIRLASQRAKTLRQALLLSLGGSDLGLGGSGLLQVLAQLDANLVCRLGHQALDVVLRCVDGGGGRGSFAGVFVDDVEIVGVLLEAVHDGGDL